MSRAAVIAWIRTMETQGDMPRTVRRRLWALSSLFRHLIDQHVVTANPVRDLKRPAVERNQGVTAAFDAAQARAILDAPNVETVEGLRDRAILSVLLQAGPRRAEVAGMKVKDLHTNRGYPSLRTIRKGGKQHSLSQHPQTAQRIQEYLKASGHGEDLEGPRFRAVRTNGKDADAQRHLDPDRIDRIVRKYTQEALGIAGGFRRTRVGRRLRRALSPMARRWKMCRRRWGMPTAVRPGSTTSAETIPSVAPPSLPTFRAERIPTASEMSETILTWHAGRERDTMTPEEIAAEAAGTAAQKAALRIYTEAAFPQQWATTHNNLGSGKDSCKIHTLSRIHLQNGLILPILPSSCASKQPFARHRLSDGLSDRRESLNRRLWKRHANDRLRDIFRASGQRFAKVWVLHESGSLTNSVDQVAPSHST